ncbi:DUF3618 domain-containing protein [Streptomyces sp. B21-101]|uniref:DUF3618 domain-containing protein n=1 Tax=Streptomyces sp. B21-101 TaxID=3039415 RepID=UPI002FF2A2B4
MTQPSQNEPAGPDELRHQVERTRHELGATVESLAAKTDVKARAQEKAAELKEQAGAKATHLSEQARSKAAEAAHALEEKVPAPVKDKAVAAAGQVRTRAEQAEQLWQDKAPEPVRDHRKAVIGLAAAATLVFLFLRRGRK